MLNAVFKKLFTKNNSKDAAKKRLQFALVCDRLEVTDDLLGNLQTEIIDVISKYFVVDKAQIQFDITRHNDSSALAFNTPILSMTRVRKNMAPSGKKARHKSKAH